MKSSIYISPERIEVIGYTRNASSICVRGYASLPVPPGTAINGKIIDRANLIQCLAELRSTHGALLANPTLIVDGNSILTRNIKAPKLSKKNYKRLVKDEFSDSTEESEGLVCDYHHANEKNNSDILACAAERTLIEDYIEAFKEANIRLKAINIGVEAVSNYIRSYSGFHKESFVVNVVDGMVMLSMIFVNNESVFISRGRIYGDTNEEIARDLLQNLSGLTKFTKSEKLDDITHSLYLGLDDEAMAVLKGINANTEMKLESLTIRTDDRTGRLSKKSHFTLLNTFQGSGAIDLLRGYKELRSVEKGKNKLVPLIAGGLGVILAFGGYWAFMTVRTAELDRQIEDFKGFLNNDTNVGLIAEIERIEQEILSYGKAAGQIKEKEDSNRAMPAVTHALMEFILSATGSDVKIVSLSFDEKQGVIKMMCLSTTQPDSLVYVEILKENELVNAVNYTGFKYDSGKGYSFSIELEPAEILRT